MSTEYAPAQTGAEEEADRHLAADVPSPPDEPAPPLDPVYNLNGQPSLENAQQYQAIARVLMFNGEYLVDEKRPGKPVVLVSLMGTPIKDDRLDFLRHMPSLRRLWLNCTPITDLGLVHRRTL